MHRDQARARGILINAADVLWLASLPAGTTEPYGELVWHRVMVPFRGTPLTVQNRTDG